MDNFVCKLNEKLSLFIHTRGSVQKRERWKEEKDKERSNGEINKN